MARRTLTLLALCLATGVARPLAFDAAGAPAAVPRVHIFTAPVKSDVPTEEEQGRLDTVHDMQDEVAKHAKKATLVADAAEAQVLVEVISREKRDMPSGGFGGRTITPLVETTVRLHAVYGTHEIEIRGVGQAYWARAAKDAADRLLNWIGRMAARP